MWTVLALAKPFRLSSVAWPLYLHPVVAAAQRRGWGRRRRWRRRRRGEPPGSGSWSWPPTRQPLFGLCLPLQGKFLFVCVCLGSLVWELNVSGSLVIEVVQECGDDVFLSGFRLVSPELGEVETAFLGSLGKAIDWEGLSTSVSQLPQTPIFLSFLNYVSFIMSLVLSTLDTQPWSRKCHFPGSPT